MQSAITVLEYQGHPISFEITNIGLMVDATEMARTSSKKFNDYLEDETTTGTMQNCLQNNDNRFGITAASDVMKLKADMHVWLNPYMAYKFSEWINKPFEIWIMDKMDRLRLGDTDGIHEA